MGMGWGCRTLSCSFGDGVCLGAAIGLRQELRGASVSTTGNRGSDRFPQKIFLLAKVDLRCRWHVPHGRCHHTDQLEALWTDQPPRTLTQWPLRRCMCRWCTRRTQPVCVCCALRCVPCACSVDIDLIQFAVRSRRCDCAVVAVVAFRLFLTKASREALNALVPGAEPIIAGFITAIDDALKAQHQCLQLVLDHIVAAAGLPPLKLKATVDFSESTRARARAH